MTLVPLPRGYCPGCGTTLREWWWHQPALLRHAGYGATEQRIIRWCPGCGWQINTERSEVKP